MVADQAEAADVAPFVDGTVASDGEVPIDAQAEDVVAEADRVERLGAVTIDQAALLDVSGDSGGRVWIRGGRVEIRGSAGRLAVSPARSGIPTGC